MPIAETSAREGLRVTRRLYIDRGKGPRGAPTPGPLDWRRLDVVLTWCAAKYQGRAAEVLTLAFELLIVLLSTISRFERRRLVT
jgi:hypothetical protein